MTPVFFVMAILGCGDSNVSCEQARIAPAHYATIAQCRAALPQGIADNSDLSYPVIAADCRASGPLIATVKTSALRG